jgi:hypothetical protein
MVSSSPPAAVRKRETSGFRRLVMGGASTT